MAAYTDSAGTSATSFKVGGVGGCQILSTDDDMVDKLSVIRSATEPTPVAGRRWVKTDGSSDINQEPECGAYWEYIAPYWRSEEVYSTQRNVSNISASDSIFVFVGTKNHDFYFLALEVGFYIQATHNSTNYWQAEFSHRDPSNVETSVQVINSWQTGRTITTWYRDRADINQHLDISAVNFRMGNFRFTKVGNPGPLFAAEILYYRLVRQV